MPIELPASLVEQLPVVALFEHDPHRPEDVLKWDTDEDGNGGDDPYDALRYGLMDCPGPPVRDNIAEILANWRG